ncbi:MAG: aminoacyl-tRNA hydrolase [Polyangiaceae bacterium]|nr:aminoacyl-tRNA hydrolase [Polyangiaceae bacterium]
MAEPILVAPGVEVPAAALEVRAVRAGGPGGQNVNKVSSKVELYVDLARVSGLTMAQRGRLAAATRGRLCADGRLLMVSQLTRDQPRNLEDARERVRRVIAEALPAPRVRRATRPTKASVTRRLDEKRAVAARKRSRSGRGGD